MCIDSMPGQGLHVISPPTIRHFVGRSIAEVTPSTMVYTCTKFHAFMNKLHNYMVFVRICPTMKNIFSLCFTPLLNQDCCNSGVTTVQQLAVTRYEQYFNYNQLLNHY